MMFQWHGNGVLQVIICEVLKSPGMTGRKNTAARATTATTMTTLFLGLN